MFSGAIENFTGMRQAVARVLSQLIPIFQIALVLI